MPLDTLNEVLQGLGKVIRHDLESIGRYRPNRAASKAGSEVGEVLFFVDKTALSYREAA